MTQKIIIAIILATVLAGCSGQQQAPEQELVKTVNVETETVELQPFERYLKLVGTVESENDVEISSEVSGRILNYFVEQGDHVEKGEPILKIDDAQLIQERERLEAVTAQAKENYERLMRLYKQEGIGSEIDYLNAKYTYEQSKAALEAVKISIEKTTINAPFSASVEEILLEEGEMAAPGTTLVRLIGTEQLEVSTGVPSAYANVVSEGDIAQVWFDFATADTLQLPISFVGKSISEDARTFEVVIELPRESEYYKVDMIANVKIRTMQEDSLVVISNEFIQQGDGRKVVYVASTNKDGDKIALRQPVSLGASYKNSVVVTGGLKPGDELITVGSAFLQDSMRINIVNENSLAQRNI
ncbi:MAG TPA: efflux RND transporter periplasmic adaptor subunit [Balneolaceae bacterium]